MLTFIACYELIQLVIGHNNLANFETWIFWKWIFKTFVAVTLMSEAQTVKNLLHEASHQALHSREAMAGSDEKKSKNQKECEAESVAYRI